MKVIVKKIKGIVCDLFFSPKQKSKTSEICNALFHNDNVISEPLKFKVLKFKILINFTNSKQENINDKIEGVLRILVNNRIFFEEQLSIVLKGYSIINVHENFLNDVEEKKVKLVLLFTEFTEFEKDTYCTFNLIQLEK